MHTTSLIKFLLLLTAVLTFLPLAVVVVNGNPSGTDANMIYNLYFQHPIRVYLFLTGIIILAGLILWTLRWRPPLDLYKKYKKLDSGLLDSNPALCREFFNDIINYYIKAGKLQFYRYIISHFHFFYDFHNQALSWIDEIASNSQTGNVPREFILSAISSGKIGKVFMQANYASGLPLANIKTDEPIIFHTCADIIELWSYNMAQPLTRLNKDSIRLQNCHRHPGYVSGSLIGRDKIEKAERKIGLRFLPYNPHTGVKDESIARERIVMFKQWLKSVTSNTASQYGHYGIDVTDLTHPLSCEEAPIVHELKRLKNKRLIHDYFTDMPQATTEHPFSFDAIVLADGVGIVTVTEKYENGEIIFSGDRVWHQHVNNQRRNMANACQQAGLNRANLSLFLATHQLARWPIHNLVVFTSTNVGLSMTMGKQRLQCNVLSLSKLVKWFETITPVHDIEFDEQSLQQFTALFEHRHITPQRLATV